MHTNKAKGVLAALALAAMVTMPMTQPARGGAEAVIVPVVTSSGSVPIGIGIFAGIVAALTSYDLIRRNTCSGDFLKLGGPGFSEPIKPTQNVRIPPKCGQ